MPPLLRSGARIAVVAPAGRFSRERLEKGAAVLHDWGYEVVYGPNLSAVDRYHAGTIDQRASDLAWACTDPTIDAVWLARGGFGCAHLLPVLPWEKLLARPLLGFSDATALHVALWLAGWTTFDRGLLVHGPVVQTLAPAPADGSPSPVLVDQVTRVALRDLLEGRPTALPGRTLCGPAAVVEGPVVGGNLTVLASLCGTRWQLRARGSIVILEDVGEAPYRLDRALTQLIQSGALAGAVGIALGQMLDGAGRDPEGVEYGPLEVLRDRLMPLRIPVLCDLPVGHGVRNLPWLFGRRGRMDGRGVVWL